MKYKKSILILLVAIFLISISSAWAVDANDTEMASGEDTQIELAADDSQITETGDEEILDDVETGTFMQLYSEIINAPSSNSIKLNRSYEYEGQGYSEGIDIYRQITIDGQGHTIDAKGQVRIFNIHKDNVVLKNITFKNANFQTGMDGGGAIYIENNNCKILDCVFIDNQCGQYRDGGAIYCSSENNLISNCVFINNRCGEYGGAIRIVNQGATAFGNVSNCVFINNSATYTNGAGGAISVYGMCQISNCSFINNHGYLDDSIHSSELIDTDYNWFGNNATDYASEPFDMLEGDTWLFLNATANPDNLLVSNTTEIIFKLYLYNKTSGKILEYDNAPFKDISLTISATNGNVNKNTTKLGESIRYTATASGRAAVSATIENIKYTIEFDVKEIPNLTVVSQEVFYNGNAAIALNYNVQATGTVNITLNGKKHEYAFENKELNATISLGNVLPDEYDVTVTYSGDGKFINETSKGTLTIKQLDSNIKVESKDINVTETGAVMFVVSLPENATGNLTISNGATINVTEQGKKESGKLILEILNNGYPAGKYDWTFTYLGDDVYKDSTDAATSNILLIKTEILPVHDTIELIFGNSSKVNYTTKPIVLEGITFESSKSGVVTVDDSGAIAAVGAGSANITINFAGNETYSKSNATIKITVNKANSTLTVKDMVFDYGTAGNTTASYTGAEGVDVKVNSPDAVVEVSGNVISVSNLTVGNYTLTVTTIVDGNHYNVTRTANITVNKVDSVLVVGNMEFDFNSTGIAEVSFSGAIGINASVNSPDAVVEVSGNVISVSNLTVGNYILTVTAIADGNHYNVTRTANITVTKIKTQLDANPITATYNLNKILVITLKDSKGNALSGVRITVKLDGVKTYTTDKNGQIKVTTKGLAPKVYAAVIAFDGNVKYDKAAREVKVTVKKATPKLSAKKKTFKKSKKVKKYTVSLKNNVGKAMKNVKVTLKIKGKKAITVKTNSKGKATFKIKKLTKKGKYNASVNFKSNKYYTALTKKVKIIVK